MKHCTRCTSDKTEENFYHSRLECKACVKKRTAKWRMTNTFRRHKKDKCEECKFTPSHGCQLDVDHIDGNHNNDNPINLKTLCANCHRLKTFLSKETRWRTR